MIDTIFPYLGISKKKNPQSKNSRKIKIKSVTKYL